MAWIVGDTPPRPVWSETTHRTWHRRGSLTGRSTSPNVREGCADVSSVAPDGVVIVLRRLRSALLIVLAAVVGALLGRLATELRHRSETGEELTGALHEISLDPRTLSPRELVPGIVAAVRVHDVPWSYLHVPPWLAALSVNCGAAVLARELAQIGDLTRGGPSNDWGASAWEPGAWESRQSAVDVRATPGDDAEPARPSGPSAVDAD